MSLHLGIVYQDGKIINHRSLLKVVFNPIFRFFGFQIATPFATEPNEIVGLVMFMKHPRRPIRWERYDMTGCTLEKRRRFI